MSSNRLMIGTWNVSPLPIGVWSNLRDVKTLIDSRTHGLIDCIKRNERGVSMESHEIGRWIQLQLYNTSLIR
uniref:Endonuclease/exonuclease/phosphatase domain-containing protein n=1 Tax=viral metagenome TaxID=1070528 RepID=A0A6C0BLQ0_9ZZZZ